jgi:hypothetical protein
MYVGSAKVIFGLAAVVVPVAVFAFAAVAMIATSWRSWFGLQKKEEPLPKTAAKRPSVRPPLSKHSPPPPRRRRRRRK